MSETMTNDRLKDTPASDEEKIPNTAAERIAARNWEKYNIWRKP